MLAQRNFKKKNLTEEEKPRFEFVARYLILSNLPSSLVCVEVGMNDRVASFWI